KRVAATSKQGRLNRSNIKQAVSSGMADNIRVPQTAVIMNDNLTTFERFQSWKSSQALVTSLFSSPDRAWTRFRPAFRQPNRALFLFAGSLKPKTIPLKATFAAG